MIRNVFLLLKDVFNVSIKVLVLFVNCLILTVIMNMIYKYNNEFTFGIRPEKKPFELQLYNHI